MGAQENRQSLAEKSWEKRRRKQQKEQETKDHIQIGRDGASKMHVVMWKNKHNTVVAGKTERGLKTIQRHYHK